MELIMPDDHHGISASVWKALAPAQQSALTWLLMRQARSERSRAIGKVLLRVAGGPLRALVSVRRAWRRHLRHRQDHRDLAVLSSMNDVWLRDIGISRSEVRAAIRSRTDRRLLRR
jgi:uncharacterized protein YjiS (DUF1127 family)